MGFIDSSLVGFLSYLLQILLFPFSPFYGSEKQTNLLLGCGPNKRSAHRKSLLWCVEALPGCEGQKVFISLILEESSGRFRPTRAHKRARSLQRWMVRGSLRWRLAREAVCVLCCWVVITLITTQVNYEVLSQYVHEAHAGGCCLWRAENDVFNYSGAVKTLRLLLCSFLRHLAYWFPVKIFLKADTPVVVQQIINPHHVTNF